MVAKQRLRILLIFATVYRSIILDSWSNYSLWLAWKFKPLPPSELRTDMPTGKV